MNSVTFHHLVPGQILLENAYDKSFLSTQVYSVDSELASLLRGKVT